MRPSDDPRLRQLVEESRRQAREAVRDLRATTSELRRTQSQLRTEQQRSADERATEARRGGLGPAMQRVQERIDRRQTTWEAVVSGADTHPSAIKVRADIDRGLDDFRRAAEQDPEVIEAQIEARAAAARMREGGGRSPI